MLIKNYTSHKCKTIKLNFIQPLSYLVVTQKGVSVGVLIKQMNWSFFFFITVIIINLHLIGTRTFGPQFQILLQQLIKIILIYIVLIAELYFKTDKSYFYTFLACILGISILRFRVTCFIVYIRIIKLFIYLCISTIMYSFIQLV